MGKKQHREQVIRYELTGLFTLTLAALALGRLGVVGRYIDVAFIYLAGSWSFLVPIFIGYAAIYMMVQRSTFPWTNRHMGLLVLFITWLTGMEFDLFQHVSDLQATSLFQATWVAIREMSDQVLEVPGGVTPPYGAGGGLVGFLFFSVFHYLFSTLGTFIVLGVGVLIGGALVTQRSLVSGVQRGTRWMERRLDALWDGSKQYVSLLFGPERKHAAEADEAAAEKPARRSRRKPELIVDGEVVSASDAASPEAERTPVVHDFAARLRAKHPNETIVVQQPSADASSADEAVMEQRGNRIVMRYPDTKPSAKGEPKQGAAPAYTVGVPVRDDHYQLPPIRMFALPDVPKGGFNHRDAQENARKLEATLESFGVQAKVLEISRGPTVTRYEIQPAVGVKVSKIVSLTDDIALALAARDIRIEAPIPGKAAIGIEVPNPEVAIVTLREVLESPEFQQEDSKLAIALGRDISGAAIVGNLQKMPHLLVAGATGSGKSVCINGIIASILVKAKPHEVKLLMIDPKMVELSGYNGIPHLLAPVVTDPRKAAFALKKIIQEMESRYQSFADRGARDIERYNQLMRAEGLEPLPYIVVIVDELADLMMVAPGDVEDAICRIAQMARAAGIHLIVATQRPSVDVITGVIKANIPSRIAFAVSSMADSRTILDGGGAEKLLGRGDMLYLPVGASKPIRVQGAFVSEREIEQLVKFVKEQQNAVYTVDLNHEEEPSGNSDGPELDELFVDAMDLVIESGQASVSMIQRRFRVGYSRAARIIDQMEQRGFIGGFEGSKPREVLITADQWHMIRSSLRETGS
ncbi:cell division protein FtsK [Alicyclobacillus cycloheptanicus]|uniref:S-DNA-T family DNA segregation ATPase FtsK/SpoIIIE n=1 Tax=Alicyclobacillus cycloheptanicus TaxID=1457 RepID=A0ABT9XHV6_9BACL|nr:DNA translocase FtsK [Alicyclobacillus cycloheptanicus]MDQ0189286.1 S-DNA-T family DNA segregation ATPase FtsK/SpoIIIE [Alicyclobacillus cycloheptanicus]WDM01350.1 cell division protein FtsK [Alicyclobacillus cycloheptanicus]